MRAYDQTQGEADLGLRAALDRPEEAVMDNWWMDKPEGPRSGPRSGLSSRARPCGLGRIILLIEEDTAGRGLSTCSRPAGAKQD